MGNEKCQHNPRRPSQRTHLHPPCQSRSTINENFQQKIRKVKRGEPERRNATRQPASLQQGLRPQPYAVKLLVQ